MIYATVGTMFMDFSRLIRAMDEFCVRSGERTIVQIGMSETIPRHAEHFEFKPHQDILKIQLEARVIVAHAGIGCVLDALALKKPLIVVPRRRHLGEHMDDHQVQIADAVERRGWGRKIDDVSQLAEALADPPPPPPEYAASSHRLACAVRDAVDRIAAGLPIP